MLGVAYELFILFNHSRLQVKINHDKELQYFCYQENTLKIKKFNNYYWHSHINFNF